jgi:hypothetical protein
MGLWMSARGWHRWHAYHFHGERVGTLEVAGICQISPKHFSLSVVISIIEGKDTKYANFVVVMVAILVALLIFGG